MLDLYAADEPYTYLEDLARALVAPAVQGPIVTISVAAAVREATGVDLTDEPIESALPALAAVAGCDAADSAKKIVEQFVERVIEPKAADCAALIGDFPVGGSEPCARLRPGTMGIANRFEIFINGVEVVHGYEDEVDMDAFVARASAVDLLDDDQRRLADRVRRGEVPKTVGLGLGIERLAMVIDGSRDITSYRFASDF